MFLSDRVFMVSFAIHTSSVHMILHLTSINLWNAVFDKSSSKDGIAVKTAVESVLTSKGAMDGTVQLRKEHLFLWASLVEADLSLQN